MLVSKRKGQLCGRLPGSVAIASAGSGRGETFGAEDFGYFCLPAGAKEVYIKPCTTL